MIRLIQSIQSCSLGFYWTGAQWAHNVIIVNFDALLFALIKYYTCCAEAFVRNSVRAGEEVHLNQLVQTRVDVG